MSNPIVIVGTGRCGSTALHQILARHPKLTWFSQLCNRYPDRPALNRLAMRSLDVPGLSRLARRYLYPTEAYRFWDYHCSGFSRPCRDLVAADVRPNVASALRDAVDSMLPPDRSRLLIKITGWPRLGFLKAIFPQARFIHVYRDGRAVANSLVNVAWWDGWRGPALWQWADLSRAEREKWERLGRSFVALAGIEWEMLMAAQERARRDIPAADFMEVRYEDMCDDPAAVLRRVAEYAELDWLPEFAAAAQAFPFRNANPKWRNQLTDSQQCILQECLADSLRRYGYT